MTLKQLENLLEEAEEHNKNGNFEVSEKICRKILAKTSLSSTSTTTIRIKALILLVNSLWRCGMSNEAIPYAQEVMAIAKQPDDDSEIAEVQNLLGSLYDSLGDYPLALENYENALLIFEKKNNKRMTGGTKVNIGSVYFSLGDYSRALKYYQNALADFDDIGEKSFRAIVIGNLGSVYNSLGEYTRSLEYYSKAIVAFDELGMKAETIIFTDCTAGIHAKMGDYTSALECFGKSLRAFEELGMKSDAARVIGEIGLVYSLLGNYSEALEYYGKSLAGNEELGLKSSVASVLQNIGGLYAEKNFEVYNPKKAEEILFKALTMNSELGAKQQLYQTHKILAILYEQEGDTKRALSHFKNFYELEHEVKSEEAKNQAVVMEQRLQEEERRKQIAIAKATADAKHQTTMNILHKTLPPVIADRLITGEKDIADRFVSVSILFADIVGFTPLSTRKTPREVVHILNNLFSRFDALTKKYGVERIKTIGDAYMVVSGAPEIVADHATRIAYTAFGMLEAIVAFNAETGENINVRIGLNSGEAIAAVVGDVKFSYDLWSDAVNMASRMESHGVAGKIHCSEEFRNSLYGKFTFTERGETEIKGKGKMRTYFLEWKQ